MRVEIQVGECRHFRELSRELLLELLDTETAREFWKLIVDKGTPIALTNTSTIDISIGDPEDIDDAELEELMSEVAAEATAE